MATQMQLDVIWGGNHENKYDFSLIKRVTNKFLEVSRCSRAKQGQGNVQKRCATRAKLLFGQLD